MHTISIVPLALIGDSGGGGDQDRSFALGHSSARRSDPPVPKGPSSPDALQTWVRLLRRAFYLLLLLCLPPFLVYALFPLPVLLAVVVSLGVILNSLLGWIHWKLSEFAPAVLTGGLVLYMALLLLLALVTLGIIGLQGLLFLRATFLRGSVFPSRRRRG